MFASSIPRFSLAFLLTLSPALLQAADKTFIGTPGDNTWNNDANWDPSGVPMDGDNVTIDIARNVLLDMDVTLGNFCFGTGSFASPSQITSNGSTITVGGAAEWRVGSLFGSGIFNQDSLLEMSNGAATISGWNFNNNGIMLMVSSSITLAANANFNNTGILILSAGSIFNGTGTFVNTGDFSLDDLGTASLGPGIAFSSTDGSIGSTDGMLDLDTDVFIANTTLESKNGVIALSRGSTSSNIAYEAFDLGTVEYRNGTHLLIGTHTSIGDGQFDPLLNLRSAVYARGGAQLDGDAVLALDSNAPFILSGAEVLPTAEFSSTGFVRWEDGTINGEWTHVNADADSFFIDSVAGSRILGGILRNGTDLANGAMTHQGTTTINGALINATTGIFTTLRGSLRTDSTLPELRGQIINQGVFRKQGESTSSTTITAEFTSDGIISISRGELRLRRVATLGGRVEFSPDANGTPELVLGGESTLLSSTTLAGTEFHFDDGQVRIEAGIHPILGIVTASGIGKIVQRNGHVVPTSGLRGGLPRIDLSPGAVYELDGSFARIGGATPLTVVGEFHLKAGTIVEAGLRNLGDAMRVTGNGVRISDGTSGLLENLGTITHAAGNTLGLADGARLINEQPGVYLLEGHLNGIGPVGGANDVLIVNNGRIEKTGGGFSGISVPYRQLGFGSLGSTDGDLQLTGMTELLGGTIFADGSDASVVLTGPSQNSGFTVDTRNGGLVHFQSNTHLFSGTLSGTGDGTTLLSAGTLRVEDGGQGLILFASAASLRQTGGTLGGGTGSLEILANHEFTDGTILGTVEHRGILTMTGGTIDGAFTNLGQTDVQGGQIRGDFINGLMGAEDPSPLVLKFTGSNERRLREGADLISFDRIIHQGSGDLILHDDTAISLQGVIAKYDFEDSGDIRRVANQSGRNIFRLEEGATLRKSQGVNRSNVEATVISEESTIETAGELRLLAKSGAPHQIGNETVLVASNPLPGNPAMLLVNDAILSGNIHHSLDNGQVEYENAVLDAILDSQGTGTVTLETVTVPVAATLAMAASAPAVFSGGSVNVDANAALNNTGQLVLENTAIQLSPSSVFANAANATIDYAASPASVAGDASATFVNDGRIVHSTGAAFRLGGQLALQNRGEYVLNANGSVLKQNAADTSRLINSGRFAKESGTGQSFVDVAFDNVGEVEVASGQLFITGDVTQLNGTLLDGGQWTVRTNSTLTLENNQTITASAANILLDGANATFSNLPDASSPFTNQGTFAVTNGANFAASNIVNDGEFEIGSNSQVNVDEFENNALLRLTNGSLSVSTNFSSSGSIVGTGNITSPQLQLTGRIALGLSPGTLTLDVGTYEQTATSELVAELSGLIPGLEYDQLLITGAATIDGSLDVQLIDQYAPTIGDAFEILKADGGLTGVFATEQLPEFEGLEFMVDYTPTSVFVRVLQGIFAGDFDEDFDVDGDDFLIWQANFGTTAGATHMTGDSDADGDVDGDDFLKGQAQFGNSAGGLASAGGSSVPEPDTGILASLLLVTWFALIGMRITKPSMCSVA